MKFPLYVYYCQKLVASYRTAQRVGNFRWMLSQVTASWTCIQTCVERANDSCSLLAGWRANNLCLLTMGGQREKNVRGLACKSIDFDQGECRPLQVLTCNSDHVWQILEEKIKKFHDGTDLPARIDRDYQSGATLHFPLRGYSGMDWQAIKKAVE